MNSMTGRITRTSGINPAWEIEIDGYPEMRFMGYNKDEAIRKYKRLYGLSKRRATWRDYSEDKGNLFDAVMQSLKGE